MRIIANTIHERTLKANQAVLAHPELRPYMKPELLRQLEERSALLGPLLQIVATAKAEDDAALERVDAIYQQSRDMILWLHDGVRYCYRQYPEELARLAPMRLGTSAADDGVRLATLHRVLPELQPAFVWLPGEGLTLAALGEQSKAHREAEAEEPTLGASEKEALARLRAERPASEALWSNEGGRLDSWIITNVPSELHFTFGRERRQRPRAAVKTPPDTTEGKPKG